MPDDVKRCTKQSPVLKKSLTVIVMMIVGLHADTTAAYTRTPHRSAEDATAVEKCVVYVCKATIIINDLLMSLSG